MKRICHDITSFLGRSADYREKRSHNCMIDSHWAWNILPQNIFNATNESRISIKCCLFTYFEIELLMSRKKHRSTCSGYETSCDTVQQKWKQAG